MADTIRIAFLEEWPSLRGVRILPGLAKTFDITYITSAKGEMPEAAFKEVKMFPAPRYINQWSLAFSRLADRLYQENKIDFAVHYAGVAFLTRKVPVINLLGGSYYSGFLSQWRSASLLRKIRLIVGYLHYSLPEKIGYRRAHEIITISEGLKNELISYYGRNNKPHHVVYNGIDEDFKAVGEKKDRDRNEPPQILFSGRLHEGKGIRKLVETFHRDTRINASFYIAGDGPDYEPMARICQHDSRIHLLGHISRQALLQRMSSTSIFVFPSHHEGLGNSLLEAMAGRHACICYDIPVVQEVAAGTCLLVPLGRSDLFCEELAQLTKQPEQIQQLANRAYERAGLFSWERCADEVTEILTRFYGKIRSQ